MLRDFWIGYNDRLAILWIAKVQSSLTRWQVVGGVACGLEGTGIKASRLLVGTEVSEGTLMEFSFCF